MVGNWGMRPKDFWKLTPVELMWLIEAKRPVKMYGKLTEDEVAELYQYAYGESDG